MLVTDRFSSPYFSSPPPFFFLLGVCVCVFFFTAFPSFRFCLSLQESGPPPWTRVVIGKRRYAHTHEKKRSAHFIPFSILQFPVLCAPISSGRPAKCLQIFDRIGWGVRPPHSHNRREIDKKKINKTIDIQSNRLPSKVTTKCDCSDRSWERWPTGRTIFAYPPFFFFYLFFFLRNKKTWPWSVPLFSRWPILNVFH